MFCQRDVLRSTGFSYQIGCDGQIDQAQGNVEIGSKNVESWIVDVG